MKQSLADGQPLRAYPVAIPLDGDTIDTGSTTIASDLFPRQTQIGVAQYLQQQGVVQGWVTLQKTAAS
jgi:hypothetical protein